MEKKKTLTKGIILDIYLKSFTISWIKWGTWLLSCSLSVSYLRRFSVTFLCQKIHIECCHSLWSCDQTEHVTACNSLSQVKSKFIYIAHLKNKENTVHIQKVNFELKPHTEHRVKTVDLFPITPHIPIALYCRIGSLHDQCGQEEFFDIPKTPQSPLVPVPSPACSVT